MRYALPIIGLVLGVAAAVLLIFAAVDPMGVPAPRQAPVPLSSVIGD